MVLSAASRTFFGPGKKPEIAIAHDPSRRMEVGMILKRIAPLSLAKISGVLYAIIGFIVGCCFALMSGPQSVNELDRLVTASSVIDAWLTRLKVAPVAKSTIGLQADIGPVVATAQAPDYRIDTLPVDSIATGGGERFAIREPELIRYVQRAAP